MTMHRRITKGLFPLLRKSGDGSALAPGALRGLGDLYKKEGRDSEAERCFLRAFDLQEKAAQKRADAARTLGFQQSRLLNLYRDQGRLSEMEPICKRALVAQEIPLGPQDKAISQTLEMLARLYGEEHKYDDAVANQQALKIEEANLGPDSPNLAFFLDECAGLLQQLGKPNETAAARARADSLRGRSSSTHQPGSQ
jgi:hypothetical protein